MPSQLHEVLLLLFRNRPQLAPELLREVLHVELPDYTEVRIDSAELTQVQPTEYRADLVVLLLDDVPVLGIVLEAQLHRDDDKRFVWPVYVTNLRGRIRCPVTLMVISPDDAVARWCAQPIELGGGNVFHAMVIGPSGVPIVTDEAVAMRDPELAVLSAMAHGRTADPDIAVQIAIAAIGASVGLDAERSVLYFDLVRASLGDVAKRSLQAMDPAKYEFQSDFAKRFIEVGRQEGRQEGRTEGQAATLLKLLRLKFGVVSQDVVTRVQSASIEDLDHWAERILDATSIDDTLR